MRISVTASLFLTLGFIHPLCVSIHALPEDVEGSGPDLDSSGSGSGDWSEQDMKVHPDSKDKATDILHRPVIDIESEFVVVGSSKSFFESPQILSGIIAGGVTGAILAAILTALIIIMWQKKGDREYIQGQQTYRDEIVV